MVCWARVILEAWDETGMGLWILALRAVYIEEAILL